MVSLQLGSIHSAYGGEGGWEGGGLTGSVYYGAVIFTSNLFCCRNLSVYVQ